MERMRGWLGAKVTLLAAVPLLAFLEGVGGATGAVTGCASCAGFDPYGIVISLLAVTLLAGKLRRERRRRETEEREQRGRRYQVA